MFDRRFFESLLDKAASMNAAVKREFDQEIFRENPAVQVNLADGAAYRLTFVGAGWWDDQILSAVAYSPQEEAWRLVFIPYETIVRVEAFDPGDGAAFEIE